jgi:trans-2-enoyl-CoA reductase
MTDLLFFSESKINVVREGRPDLVAELKELGADEVVASNEEDMVEAVKRITGGKLAFAAVDSVGGDLFSKVVSSVRNFGTVIIYGAMSGLQVQGFHLVSILDTT